VCVCDFFCFLKQPRPHRGLKRRWKDVIRQDLKFIGVDEDKWYNEAVTSREGWRALWRRKPDRIPVELHEIHCSTCLRYFSRESDRKRHKCIDECSS